MAEMIAINNSRNCANCNKLNVCKYSVEVKDIEILLKSKLTSKSLPLTINIICKEHSNSITVK
jgi:hypothetical protein